jgi:hypothetical protein
LRAATMVVPVPQKGSRTVSPTIQLFDELLVVGNVPELTFRYSHTIRPCSLMHPFLPTPVRRSGSCFPAHFGLPTSDSSPIGASAPTTTLQSFSGPFHPFTCSRARINAPPAL